MNEPPSDIPVMATIGHVCLQYSRLEIMLAGILFVLLDLDEDKGAVVVGPMDLKARLRVGLNLLTEMRAPSSLRRRLKAVETELREKDLIERRNQAVHGAHKIEGGEYVLTMLRWTKGKRHQPITIESLHDLGNSLCTLGTVTFNLMGDIERWRFRSHGVVNIPDKLDERSAVANLNIWQRLYASAQHLWRNFLGL